MPLNTFGEVENMLGPRLYMSISKATDEVINHVDAAVAGINQVAGKLTASLKKQYPDEEIIGFEIPAE